MLEVVALTADHLAAARELAAANYAEAVARIGSLPAGAAIPDLTPLANGLGVAALANGRLIGYLGCVEPFEGLFGPVRGTFAPLHAHGAIATDRARIYRRMYTAAAHNWVRQGIVSHAIVLYQDDSIVRVFFELGFGMRTVDAVRLVAPLDSARHVDGVTYGELTADERLDVLPLHRGLTVHLRTAPVFLPNSDFNLAALADSFARRNSRVFVARAEGQPIGYLEVTADGENFATTPASMANICGAYVVPRYRGGGVADALLAFLLQRLDEEGYGHLGVDYEAFNPTAAGFWSKHFTRYTAGVARRIDERIVTIQPRLSL